MKGKLLLIFIVFASFSWSQLGEIEKLKKQLRPGKEDSINVNVYNNISSEYRLLGSSDEAMFFAKKGLELAKQLHYFKGIVSSWENMGMICDDQGNYPEAMRYFKKALDLAKEIKLDKQIASIHNNKGVVFRNQGDYPNALREYFLAMRVYERINDQQGISSIYGNIGVVYYNQGNLEEALKNQLESLKIKEKIKDKVGLANSYGNIGIIYDELHQYDTGLKYHFKGLKIQKALGDQFGIANSYNNIGVSYEEKQVFGKAKVYFEKALRMRKKLKDKDGEAAAYLNLGYIFTSLKNYDLARTYIIRSLNLSQKIGSKEGTKYAYHKLSELESETGNFEKALSYYKSYIEYRDSLNNEESENESMQEAMKYEFDKREAISKERYASQIEKQRVLANERTRKQRIVIWSIVSGLILALTFAIFMVRRYRLTQSQKRIIENQKGIVEQQKHDIEEKHREITDSIRYAKRIQDAILPSDTTMHQLLPDSFVLYLPKDVVAGDFYWIEQMGDWVFFAAADCTGHGVPGAMMSVVCSNALTKALYEVGGKCTALLLDRTREMVIHSLANSNEGVKDGMDISVAAWNKSTNELKWSGANNPLWIARNKEIIEVQHDKQPIGVFDELKPFTPHTMKVQQGDIIYLFTDGFPDQFGGENGKKFKSKQLKSTLLKINDLQMKQQCTLLEETFLKWKGELEQVDDVCVLGVRVN